MSKMTVRKKPEKRLREAEERLRELDGDFDERLPEVQKTMVAAVTKFDAEIKELPDGGRIVFRERAGSSVGRLKFVKQFRDSGSHRELFKAMPWELFEDTPEKRQRLVRRIGLKLVPREQIMTGPHDIPDPELRRLLIEGGLVKEKRRNEYE